MDGIGENTAVIGDWLPPSPSPRSLFSTILYETVSPNPSSEPSGGEFMLGFEEMRSQNKDDDKYGKPTSVSGDHLAETRASSEPKIISRGSLVERMAARAGFHAPKLNTGNIRSSDAPPNADVHSSRSMIPPGLSPRILLESPVFVSNSMVQPSPTTGRFPFITDSNIRSATLTSEAEKTTAGHFGDLIASFTFKPVVESGSFFHRGAPNKAIAASSIYHSSQATQVSGQSHLASQSVEPQKAHEESSNQVHLQEDFSRSSSEKDTGSTVVGSGERSADMANDGSVEHSPPVSEHRDMDGEQQDGGVTVDCDGGGSGSSGGASAEYGYNWRKYGQKQVKGSEYPRSYYKCTHPNCPVKKVERSQEGHITEIIYKGAHNHMKPLPCRRSAIGFLNQLGDIHLNVSDPGGSHIDLDQSTQRDPPASSKWRNENLEVTSALSVGTDSCNQSTMLQPQNGTHFEAGDVLDVSSTFSHDEDEDDPGTHGSVSTGYEGEGDESESKRRKIEPYTADMNGATRSIREPRVVVQTTSEVDILDDGYRWRKYGQKVVKGNPNPRSYYKCTHAGCTVRKHVERASHDLKSVITTYEGKHNHDVPAARNSSHFNTGASNDVTSKGAPAIQTHVSRLEPSQIHNSMPMFEAPASLREFGVLASAQLGPHSYTYGMSRNSLANLAMGGFGPSQGRLPVLSRPPYSEQHHQVNQIGFTFPGEPKVEPVTDSVLNLPDDLQLAYPQVTGGLPLVRQM